MASPCGCGDLGGKTVSTNGVRTGYTPSPGPNGIIELANYPGNFDAYYGASRGSSVYVVGLPSSPEEERIFLRADVEDAMAYARQSGLRLHHLAATSLCSDAMVDVFGG